MITNRQDQRVSVATKHSDDWKVGNLHYWLNLAYSENNKTETLDNINAANGIVDSKTYEYVLNPLQAGGNKLKNLPGAIRDVDFITPIREKNIGEFIELPDNFTVKVNDPNITLLKNEEVAKQVKPLIEQAVVNKINELQKQQQQQQGQGQQANNLDTGMPSKDIGDLEEQIQEIITNWFDKRANTAQQLITSVKDYNDYNSKILSAFSDWWATEEVYYRVYNINDEVYFENINVQYGYPISNGEEYIDDNDGFAIIRPISVDMIKEQYDEELSTKDLEYLDSLINKYDTGSLSINVDEIINVYGRQEFANTQYVRGSNINISRNRDIRECILYFKTESKRRILYKQNQLGEIVTNVVEKDYELNVEAGDIEIKNEWITEVWKQVLLGEDYIGIYLDPTPIDVQMYDSKGHCKLPIIGKKGLLNNVYINPIPKRIIPNLALYRIITLQIERQMAKYKGTIEIIPKSLLEGDNGDAAGNMWYRLADNTFIYDDTEIPISTIQNGYRLVGNDAAVSYIKILIDMKAAIKEEAWDMANMNDSRYGNAPASSTVTNNNQNIVRARLGSMLMVTVFNYIKVRLLTTMLEYAKVAYVNGKSGSNFDKEGKVTYYNLNEGELTENEYGIYVSNSSIDFQKLKEYKDFAFAAAQNGEFELASEAIDSDNVSNIRQSIKKFNTAKDEYNKQLEQQKLEQAQRIHSEVMADKKAERDSKLEQIELKEDMQTNREVQLKAMEVNDFSNVTNN